MAMPMHQGFAGYRTEPQLETAGLRTTCGSELLAGHVPERDAEAVARLRAAGAVIFGKTNLPTFAADGQSFNPVAGTTQRRFANASTSGTRKRWVSLTTNARSSFWMGSRVSPSCVTSARSCSRFS